MLRQPQIQQRQPHSTKSQSTISAKSKGLLSRRAQTTAGATPVRLFPSKTIRSMRFILANSVGTVPDQVMRNRTRKQEGGAKKGSDKEGGGNISYKKGRGNGSRKLSRNPNERTGQSVARQANVLHASHSSELGRNGSGEI